MYEEEWRTGQVLKIIHFRNSKGKRNFWSYYKIKPLNCNDKNYFDYIQCWTHTEIEKLL